MKIVKSEKCGLISRLADFSTCYFFLSGIVKSHSRSTSINWVANQRPRGTSIVIALGLIAAISAFTIGIASTMLIAIQNTASSKKALQAEYSAQGGIEMAKKELKEIGVAYGPGAQVCNDGKPATNGSCPDGVNTGASSYFNYTVKGKDNATNTLLNGFRSVPVAGSGNAGSDCKIGENTLEGSVHPCHWNKLYYGDSVEIPLYVTTGLDPETVTNFSGLGINPFQIKARTPCTALTYTLNCTRYGVDVTPGKAKTVVNWQVSGMCGDESCGVGPTDNGGNSFIDELDLGDATASIDFSQNGVDVNDPTKVGSISSLLSNVNKPVLKLSFVNEVTDGGKNIPYLEYQILYRGGPLAASYTISINGFAEGFLYSLSGVQSPGAGLFDFAVQN